MTNLLSDMAFPMALAALAAVLTIAAFFLSDESQTSSKKTKLTVVSFAVFVGATVYYSTITPFEVLKIAFHTLREDVAGNPMGTIPRSGNLNLAIYSILMTVSVTVFFGRLMLFVAGGGRGKHSGAVFPAYPRPQLLPGLSEHPDASYKGLRFDPYRFADVGMGVFGVGLFSIFMASRSEDSAGAVALVHECLIVLMIVVWDDYKLLKSFHHHLGGQIPPKTLGPLRWRLLATYGVCAASVLLVWIHCGWWEAIPATFVAVISTIWIHDTLTGSSPAADK